MIRLKCSNCGQKIKTDDKYAGKRVSCPKCKTILQVPQAVGGTSPGQSAIIKFRCPNCDQKIGVSPDYAGKVVKCAKCKHQLRVPQPPGKPAQPQAPEGLVSLRVGGEPPAADEGRLPDLGDMNDLLQLEASAPAVEDQLQLKPETPREPSGGNLGLEPRSNLQSFDTEDIDDESSGLAKSLCKIPLAIGASIGFTVGAAILWTIIASIIGLSWLHFLCIPVAGVAGYGLVLFTESRNFGLGLLAALIGLFGIFCGKLFLAKWVVLPQMENPFAIVGEEYDKSTLTEEQIQENLEDPKSLFRAACFQLVEYGEFDREFAEKVVQANYDGRAPIGEAKQVQEGMRKVENTLGSWNPEQKREAIIAQFERDKQMFKDFGKELLAVAADANEDELPEGFRNTARETQELFDGTRSIQETKIGFAFAFIGSFSILDLLFIPVGMWGAYKIGAGKD
jgi:DNA-directed RNA polymerase subunit RPC12/RpoP